MKGIKIINVYQPNLSHDDSFKVLITDCNIHNIHNVHVPNNDHTFFPQVCYIQVYWVSWKVTDKVMFTFAFYNVDL